MTREEAEKEIRDTFTEIWADGIIKALEQEPTNDSAVDCISREATVKRLCNLAEFMNEHKEKSGDPYIMAALFIQDNKTEFPSVTPIRPKGHWIDTKEISTNRRGQIVHEVICSECSGIAYFRSMGNKYIGANLCPNCGAKMEEVKE